MIGSCRGVPVASGGAPGVAQRRRVKALGFEQSCRGSEMFVAFADLTMPGEQVEQNRMDALIKRREFEPFAEIPEYLVVGGAADEALEHGDVKAAEPPPLGREPGTEDG